MLFAVSQDPQTSTAFGTMTGPTGFTQLAQQAAASWSRVTVWYKVSTGSEGTSYSASSSLTQSDMVGAMVIYRGSGTLSLGTPVTQNDTGSNTAWTIPALTTTQSNSWAIAIVGGGGNTAHGASTIFTTWNGGYSEDLDAAYNANYVSIGFAHQLVATASTVSSTSVTCATTDTSQSVVVELKETGGGSSASLSGSAGTTGAGSSPPTIAVPL